ncbi:MAG: thiamine diphosphokinase [Candidatus Marinimicrobia bacterium]|nr:thiamine diphosphokinase [Candidatus Neomarinimicrobiota bacterium]|tara:strand:- start:810 stop:1445 length:636 start_codon:yes stop_codon:yes gene_type:complete
MKKIKFTNSVTIVANGAFPKSGIPKDILDKSKTIIACDGAANTLDENNYRIDAIIGDLDSIRPDIKDKYDDIIYQYPDQSENDLRKAIEFLISNNVKEASIIGATGKREDHTIGNIFSLSKFCSKINLKIFTETGCFICINKDTEFKSFKGQQVSLFTLNDKTKITTKGLKYNFNKNAISTIFYGTLNESVCEKFHVKINNECAIIFLCFS